jgi:hypothetical protein
MRQALLALLLIVIGVGCAKPKTEAVRIAEAPVKHKTVDEDSPDPEPYVGNIEERQMQTPEWVSSVAVAQPNINILNASRYNMDLSQIVVEKIEGALIGTGRFQVAERSRLDAVKQEIVANNNADWFNPSNASRVGKFMGAKFLVLPSVSANVGPLTTTFELQIKILETETGTMVHNYTIRTASSSLDTNASIRTCIGSLQPKLESEIAKDFPARGVIVKIIGKKHDTLWIDTRQAALIKPGMAMRILVMDEVYNPIAKTKGNFITSVGTAVVLSVESNGVTARVKSKTTDIQQGMMAEVKL